MDEYTIYPRQFKDIKQKIDMNTCFIIMAFKNNIVYETLKRAIQSCGLKYDRSDELTKSAFFINKIIASISKAGYVIVDISEQNANVLYELGIAHTLRDTNRVLILKDKETTNPSDLSHILYFEYDKNNPIQIYDHVVNFLKNNRYTNDLKEMMLLLNIIDNNQNSDYVIETLQKELTNRCIDITNMLNNMFDSLDEGQANIILIELYKLLYSKINYEEIYSIYLKLICILLRKVPLEYKLDIFSNQVFFISDIDEEEQKILNAKIEIAVELLRFESSNNALFNWIKLFLYKSSPASISLARYKLNIGFINSKSNETKKFLLNILSTENNNTLIEHAINLCRCKATKDSVDFALKIISTTENPYVFRSAIDLIADVGTMSQIEEMFKTLSKKEKFIEKNGFIKYHIKNAELKKDK